MKKFKLLWISLAAVIFAEATLSPFKVAEAAFGAEIPVLLKILAETIEQVQALQSIIVQTRATVSLLEEMNRGVKEVLKLAETAHVPLPKQVYEQAKSIEDATLEARKVYGVLPGSAPTFAKVHYRSGVEGLYLSQDAFEYSTLLDEEGRRVKEAALVANTSSATRLSAETLGALLHAVSHTNRLEAKHLEISSTKRLEDATKANAEMESFQKTHQAIDRHMKQPGFSALNAFGEGVLQ